MVMMTREVAISRIDVDTGQAQGKRDVIAEEQVLHVFLGEIHFVSILCSPTSWKELVVGHLLAEGVISSIEDIAELDFKEDHKCHVALRKRLGEKHEIISQPLARLIVSACGATGPLSISEVLTAEELTPLPKWRIEAGTISACVKQLNHLAKTFRKTGGVHAAALFSRQGQLIALAEDVGRHNAVDKAIGAGLLDRQDVRQCFVALSGRLTGDIVLKAARVGIPVLASLAAAVSSGIEVASKTGLTLVGFVRGKRMNVYANAERIQLQACS